MVTDEPLTSFESTEGRWRMGVLAPSPRLALDVKALTCYGESWPEPVSRRQVATSGAVIFVTWGAPMVVGLGGSSSPVRAFAAGVHDRPARTGHAGTQEGVGVHLSALGVCRLLGVPGADLANRCVALDEVLGRGAEVLVDQLSGTRSLSRRLAQLEAILAGGLGAGPRLSPEVIWVWRTLRAEPSAPVAYLAAEIGWSRTRLASRFAEQVGISPKRFARIVRFEKGRRLLAQGSSSLAEVAAHAGYYDQAHLCRDVSALAGCTPAELAGEIGSGGPPDP
jgi:AraC-like DNA-binding protein